LKVNVLMALFGVKPEPVTVTVIPFGPWTGERTIAGVVIVNVAEAVSDPPSLPVATTVYPPATRVGTVKVQVNVPVAEVVCEVQVWVPGVAPLNVKVEIALFGV